MMAKLWDKGFNVSKRIEDFTVGKDRELDLLLAPYDIQGTIAHITMLESVGLLGKDELDALTEELKSILRMAENGSFRIDDDVEDVHSQVELMLTEKLGDLGKKVHTGRSRNDQVLLDVKLFTRAGIKKTALKVKALFDALIDASDRYKDVLMPGYTHLQVAMPSSFGLWFGAYAETLCDDLQMLSAALKLSDRNPLGSAAGYGSSAPLNRQKTTDLLGFESMVYNSVAAQMNRGKLEREVSFALSCIAETLGRFASDCCLFNSQNFGFISLPDEMTTGSSIMPHKKNPDVFELIRAHCNKICGVPETIRLITTNLPSGYFRDMQILKEAYLPVFGELCDCLDIALFAVQNMSVKENIMEDPKYKTAFSVEEVNRLVSEGVPFRDAYKQVGMSVLEGKFEFKGELRHTHEGSLGNLCNDRIRQRMDRIIQDICPEG
ncbi:MAG: argininosuccinate lyase [Bacteroidales bacterium]|nr:argininosuccinate lyase [Bacteroidales bacterium]